MRLLAKMWNQARSWFNLAEVGQSRSSITNPLQWAMVILGGAVLLGTTIGIAAWIILALVICLIVVFSLFIYAYLFFMHTNPDVLRSENFHLSKMAIERGLVGDSLHGLVEANNQPQKALQLVEGRESDGGPQS